MKCNFSAPNGASFSAIAASESELGFAQVAVNQMKGET